MPSTVQVLNTTKCSPQIKKNWITKPGSVSNQEGQFMRSFAINVNLQQRGDGKAQNTSGGSRVAP